MVQISLFFQIHNHAKQQQNNIKQPNKTETSSLT